MAVPATQNGDLFCQRNSSSTTLLTSPALSPRINALLLLAVVLYFGYALADISRNVGNPVSYMWDFRMCYFSAKAYIAGLNPYSPSDVQALAGERILEFYYFPLSLHFFKLFTYLPYATAARLFLIIKFVLVAYLVVLWHQFFLRRSMDGVFLLFCLLAFNSTMYIDFRAGNVSVLEQAFIWSAFACFVSKRPVAFGILLVMAAMFKAVMLLFAVLVLVWPERGKFRAAASIIALVAFFVIMEWLVDPQLTKQFATHALSIIGVPQDRGILNPSAFSLFTEIRKALDQAFRIELPSVLATLAYTGWITVVTVWTWKMLGRLDMTRTQLRKTAVYIVCLLFALISVRFKDYSFILLLVPTYYLMLRINTLGGYFLLFILSVLSAERIALPGFDLIAWFVWNYYPLLLASVVWLLYVRYPSMTQLNANSEAVRSYERLEKETAKVHI